MCDNEPIIEENYPATRAFLDLLPSKMRSLAATLFLDVIRVGIEEPDQACEAIIATARNTRYPKNNKLFIADQIEKFPFEAGSLINYYLEWENLSSEEKEATRNDQSKNFRSIHMAKLPPTEKQIQYLKKLGCKGPIGNRAQASERINELLKRKNYGSQM